MEKILKQWVITGHVKSTCPVIPLPQFIVITLFIQNK